MDLSSAVAPKRRRRPKGEASEAFTQVKQAAALLAEHYADEPKPVRLRLIFQPDSLRGVHVACPQGNRKVLAFALAGEYPALREPDFAWGHEPVLASGEGFSTILHFETEPALITLAAELARLGLAVDSAWPLLTFLHALPEEWSESGAVALVAVRPDSAVAYHHPQNAGRTVLSWRGDSTFAEVGQWIDSLSRQSPDDPLLLICEDEVTASGLDSHLSGEARPNIEVISARDALGRRVALPRYHPAQLLPRESLFSAQHLAIAASIALWLAAGWAGLAFGREWWSVRLEAAILSLDGNDSVDFTEVYEDAGRAQTSVWKVMRIWSSSSGIWRKSSSCGITPCHVKMRMTRDNRSGSR
ncbi:hypothetical protein [Oleiharenicola lentus]|uniref:hypothetical protein n=1 Tax=Oleiharenicola lentus TaxID=2508720 RepID=UPI003F66958F